jgi:hypothetical protein
VAIFEKIASVRVALPKADSSGASQRVATKVPRSLFGTTKQPASGLDTLTCQFGFAIPLKHPDETGLPGPAENAELYPIEDLITREVSAKTRGIHALTLTTDTMKEFVFYIAPGADIANLHETIRSQVSSHDVQCIAVEEANWDSYRALVP